MKKVYTGNYESCLCGNLISISGDRGKMAGFTGKALPALAPKKAFWLKWHENIGKISEYENNYYYIKEYYHSVLSKIDIESFLDNEENPILLCYEPAEKFCHRHVLAEYLEIMYDVKVFDIETKDNKIIKINQRPSYIKGMLMDIIIQEKNDSYKRLLKK